MTRYELRFLASEHDEVSAILDVPPTPAGGLVLAHGAGAGMRHAFLEAVAAALCRSSIAVFRYQFPYTEAGRRRPDAQPVLLRTVRGALEKAREMLSIPWFAGGKSMGGRMTSLAAADRELPGVHGLVFLGFPLHAAGQAGTERAEHLRRVRLPMLFVQGTRDKLANMDEIETLISELGERAKLHVVKEGDHSFAVPKRTGRASEDVLAEITTAVAGFMIVHVER